MNHLLAPLIFFVPLAFAQGAVGADVGINPPFISAPVIVKMESVFTEEEEEVTTEIPFETKYQENPEEEYGQETIVKSGQPGTLRKIFEITYWRGCEIDRDLVSQREDSPTPEIISKGTKIVWRDLPTADDGVLSYWYRIPATATAYTPFCPGCSGRTYTGAIAGRGSCAVDPKLIKLGTKLYVPGYGVCTAEDTGGAIDDNEIDVCFAEEIEARHWGRRAVDVYLLTR